MDTRIISHILCGGSGTRLWPMSREAYPKQFVPLIEGKSLLQCTLERAALLGSRAICLANAGHRFLVADVARRVDIETRQILEPVARNTAAAMACGALLAEPEDLLLFLPADHYIPGAELFATTVRQGVAAAHAGYIVTFGVVPSLPSPAYGYIERGVPLDAAAGYTVARFVEKPTVEKAEQLLRAGCHFWNAGIFLVKAQALVAALQQHAPDIVTACQAATARATHPFGHTLLDESALQACRSESIDYAVLEKHSGVAVVPFDGSWSDVGSWNAVAQLHAPDASNNRLDGKAYALACESVFVSAPHRPVVALGMQNTVIIDTPDAVLVADANHAEQVKEVVHQLKLDGAEQAVQHRQVARPWGHYDSVDLGARHQVKRITVKPSAKLSLQMHRQRAEHWIVVKGTALVTRGDEQIVLAENQSAYIPIGVKHRLENPGTTDLEIIEVQSGTYLGEDDIVRFDDTYGRE